MKRVVVLGSTGSIGTQTLDVIRQHPDLLEVAGLAAGSNASALQEQARDFPAARLALFEDPSGSGIPTGIGAISDLAALEDADIVVVAVAGVIGLLPTIRAIEAGKRIALASKEVLVAAGEIVMPLVRRYGVEMVPIDSEHSAIHQCLAGRGFPSPLSGWLVPANGEGGGGGGTAGTNQPAPSCVAAQIQELILTASGGPFRGWTKAELESVTVEQALNHPTWRMGGKITIDSATLMNKGLETIEAKWLFDMDIDQVKIVVHPQSVVHSMVKFKDGSVLAQMGWPNMQLPIQYALLGPDRVPNQLKPWDPIDTPNLTFEPVDEETFNSPGLAREASRRGGTMPCAMNAANEEAANAFLRGEIGFMDVPRVVEESMERHDPCAATLEAILAADTEARATAQSSINALHLNTVRP